LDINEGLTTQDLMEDLLRITRSMTRGDTSIPFFLSLFSISIMLKFPKVGLVRSTLVDLLTLNRVD